MAPPPLRLDVPKYIMDYSLRKFRRLRPQAGRLSGIPDKEGTRGKGDFLDLVATETLHDYLHDRGKQVGSFTVSGRGDGGIDMLVWDILTDRPLSINVKTSDFPMRPGLHLIIKKEELRRPTPLLYVQCIMRVGRPDAEDPEKWYPSLGEDLQAMPPHLHVIGWARRDGPEWEHLVEGSIENTEDQHDGGQLLDEHLRPFEELVELAKNSL